MLCSPTLADLDGDGNMELVGPTCLCVALYKTCLCSLAMASLMRSAGQAPPALYRRGTADFTHSSVRHDVPVSADCGSLVVLRQGAVRGEMGPHSTLRPLPAFPSVHASAFSCALPLRIPSPSSHRLHLTFVYSPLLFPLPSARTKMKQDLAKMEALGKDVQIGKYIASGIVVFDMNSLSVKWKVHLDLSTDSTTFRAYAYSSPTVADLDGDGKLEIVVGTSVGFLYVLNSEGATLPHFPIQMGEIQGQVSVADVNDDGQLEIVAADTKGNIAAFSADGKEARTRIRRLV